MFESIDQLQAALLARHYVAERSLATAAFLGLKLRKPLFLEGEAGVGKTEVAKMVAQLLDTPLIRLQCYEGLDANAALYEWNYALQTLHLRLLEASGASREEMEASLFTRRFLQARPLLQALEAGAASATGATGSAPVLLIDEIDRADEEFEALLLELLSDFQITIPELGTITAKEPPVVVITSNRTREVHDALKRRCLYYWIEYPTFQKELQIVQEKAPHLAPMLARQMTAFIQELRGMELFKAPGIAETLDWTAALVALDQQALTLSVVQDTIGVILKYQDDIAMLSQGTLQSVLERARLRAEAAG